MSGCEPVQVGGGDTVQDVSPENPRRLALSFLLHIPTARLEWHPPSHGNINGFPGHQFNQLAGRNCTRIGSRERKQKRSWLPTRSLSTPFTDSQQARILSDVEQHAYFNVVKFGGVTHVVCFCIRCGTLVGIDVNRVA